MVKHIVTWKFLDSALGRTKAENARIVKEGLEGLAGRIPGLTKIEVGINTNPAETSADVVLVSEFASWDSLAAYQKHPEHEKVAQVIAQVRADRKCVDWEC
jgi:heme-degrading monooxygenase HmoA